MEEVEWFEEGNQMYHFITMNFFIFFYFNISIIHWEFVTKKTRHSDQILSTKQSNSHVINWFQAAANCDVVDELLHSAQYQKLLTKASTE